MINFHPDNSGEMKPRITVIGIGGAGGNAVNNMIQSQLEGVDFIAKQFVVSRVLASTPEHALIHPSLAE